MDIVFHIIERPTATYVTYNLVEYGQPQFPYKNVTCSIFFAEDGSIETIEDGRWEGVSREFGNSNGLRRSPKWIRT